MSYTHLPLSSMHLAYHKPYLRDIELYFSTPVILPRLGRLFTKLATTRRVKKPCPPFHYRDFRPSYCLRLWLLHHRSIVHWHLVNNTPYIHFDSNTSSIDTSLVTQAEYCNVALFTQYPKKITPSERRERNLTQSSLLALCYFVSFQAN